MPDDKFRVFISHKHEDHKFATNVKKCMESLSESVDCFVSGSNISAGADWNREIREELRRSHLLMLLFTNPSQNWDWCLYEAGLFTRLDVEHVHAVVSLFHPDGSPPRVLENLQGVPARPRELKLFLSDLYKSTWLVSDDWRRGALNPDLGDDELAKTAAQIGRSFPPARTQAVHHPCHRLVLDLSDATENKDGIAEDARVVEGRGATESYTLSLFRVGSGARTPTWGELVAAIGGQDAPWRHQLDRRFAAALRGELFAPTTATLRAFALEDRHRRHYRPIIYEIVRASSPTSSAVAMSDRPTSVTILFDPQLSPTQMSGSALNLARIYARYAAEVFDVFCGTVAHRSRSGPDVFNEIREAFQIINEEAERSCVFELGELEHVFGDSYQGGKVQELTAEWDARLQQLDDALVGQDAPKVNSLLDEMRELNRQVSKEATRRYLETLEADN